VLDRYRRFSLFNSPYPAHADGRAVDLYPASDVGVSPVSGVVAATRTVGCPDRPYAADRDHLIVVEPDDDWLAAAGVDPGPGAGPVARILHVEPAVEPGDRVAVGDPLGGLVRSGFFGRWVDRHLHLGLRPADRDPHRASGSLPLAAGVDVAPLSWDGRGTVVATGPSHAVLDAPTPDGGFAAVAAGGVPLDGGLTHYAGGGALAPADGPLRLLGGRVGVADGRTVAWEPVDVLANGERIVGLSLFAARDPGYGAKLVAPDHDLRVGDAVRVRIESSDDPIRLGETVSGG